MSNLSAAQIEALLLIHMGRGVGGQVHGKTYSSLKANGFVEDAYTLTDKGRAEVKKQLAAAAPKEGGVL